jgi:short-subunit dehydrogenase
MTFLASHPDGARRTFYVCDGEPISLGALFRSMGRSAGVEAGSLRLPPVVWALARRLRGILPLALRSLVEDVLWVDDRELRQLGFVPAPRGELFLAPLVRWVSDRRWPSRHRSVALVTGAASGIGRELAVQLAASGRRLLLVDRHPDVVELARQLDGAEPLELDLADGEALRRLADRVENQPGLNLVVNCAGVGVRAPVGGAASASTGALLDVNVRALTRLTEAALDRFRAASRGVVVNVASSAAFQPLAGMAVYAASKAYVLSFSEAAAAELQLGPESRGVAVITVCPSGVATNFQAAAGVKQISGESLLSPSRVAAAIGRAAHEAKSRTVFAGRRGLLMSLVARVVPRRFNAALWARLMFKAR